MRCACTLLGALLAACGGGGARDDAALPEGAWALGESGLWVTVPRARLMEANAMGAVYFTVHNRSDHDDRLVAVEAGGTIGDGAGAQLHETVLEDGVSRMRARPEGFAVPAGEDLRFEPGGPHVMLTGLDMPAPTPADAAAGGTGNGGVLTPRDDEPPLLLYLRFEVAGEHDLLIPATVP